MSGATGTRDLYLRFAGGSGYLLNMNWWQFTAGGGSGGNLLNSERTSAWNGPHQNVTSSLTNGKSYTTSIWVRSQSGSHSAKATLAITADGTTNYVQLIPSQTVNTSGWTQLAGTTTVSWTGTITNATYIETAAGTDGLYLDDTSFQ